MQSYLGHIFIPKDNNLQKVEGVRLFIDSDNFWIEAPIKMYGIEQYNLLKGAFTSLGYVTLLECNVKSTSSGSGGFNCELSINYIISGVQINNEHNLNFSSLDIKMPSLKKWLNKSVFKGDFIFKKEMVVEYPDTINFGTFDNFNLSAVFGLTQNIDRENTISVKDYVTLKIKSVNDNSTIWELLEIYRKFKKFLAFINVIDTNFDSLILFENSIKHKNQEIPIQLKFYMSSYNFRNAGLDDIEAPKFEDIKNTIQDIFIKWYSKNDLFDSVNLILEKYYQSKLSRETFFLNSSFAIEIYHRRFKSNDRLPKLEYKKIKDGIIAKLETPEEKKLFIDKLAFANEPSFRDRLESLKEDFQIILPLNFDIEAYIKKIVNTRNYIVHRSSKKLTLEGLELYYAASYLEALTKLCIYKELGFSQWQILTMFSNTREQISGLYNLNNRLQTGINKKNNNSDVIIKK
jgi:ApeA N-terminal domain 1